MNKLSTHFFCEQFSRIQSKLANQNLPWLAQLRQKAAEKLATLSFPTQREEDWKYTNFQPILNREFEFCLEKLIPSSASTSSKLPGVIIAPLDYIFNAEGLGFETYLNSPIPNLHPSLQALNTAFLQNGVFIYIPRDTQLEDPIELNITATENNAFFPLRILVLAETNSRAVIIENYTSTDNVTHFTQPITQIFLDPEAQITHYKIFNYGNESFHTGFVSATQRSHSCFTSHSFATGGHLIRSDISAHLNEPYAECHLNGLYLPVKKQHIDHHTFIQHKDSHTTSREFYKGIIRDKAHAVFNGKVLVPHGVEKIDAEQMNKNLLLSNDAAIDTKPQLEIFADDVKCSHGAAVGQLDENALFYLRSRGLPENEARSILLHAFAKEILEKQTEMKIKEKMNNLLTEILQ